MAARHARKLSGDNLRGLQNSQTVHAAEMAHHDSSREPNRGTFEEREHNLRSEQQGGDEER